MDSSFRPTVRCFGGDLSPALQDLITTASIRMIGSKCDHCGISKDDTTMKLKSCVKCRRSYYCNADCQKADWKRHKKGCLPLLDFPVGSIVKLQGNDIDEYDESNDDDDDNDDTCDDDDNNDDKCDDEYRECDDVIYDDV